MLLFLIGFVFEILGLVICGGFAVCVWLIDTIVQTEFLMVVVLGFPVWVFLDLGFGCLVCWCLLICPFVLVGFVIWLVWAN